MTPDPADTTAPAPTGRVVIVVIDALRADRLGCYGHTARPTTPTIDRLAKEGVSFDSFRAASPWTAPAFGSILTGVSPTVHRAGKRLAEKQDGAEKIGSVLLTSIHAQVPTLSEIIGDIPSAAFVTNGFLHPKLGFGRGFELYDHETGSLNGSRRADEVNKTVIPWLEAHRKGPFFAMIHYMDPHISYDPVPKYRALFAPGPAGRVKVPFTDVGGARSGLFKPTAEERTFIDGLYDGEVRFVDDQIGALLKAMDGLGMLDDTWIAITADHGEELFDHGSFEHGHRYEDEVIRLPLVIRAPGGSWSAGKRVPYSASQVDLLPTILEWLGVAAPNHLEGRSLTMLITGQEQAHRASYTEYNLFWTPRHALFDGRHKLIRDIEGPGGILYDLKNDPREQTRLPADDRHRAPLQTQLDQRLERLGKVRDGLSADQVVEMPEEVRKALESLGYLRKE